MIVDVIKSWSVRLHSCHTSVHLSSVPLQSCALVLAAALTLLLGTLAAGTAEAPAYSGLKPDEFLKHWLILKPIPVSGQKQNPPDEAAQRQAFAQDWLREQGGEPNIHPQPGLKQKIGDRELVWQQVDSDSENIDLRQNSDPSNFALAYAWAEIDLPEKTAGLLGIGSDDAIKVWLNGTLVHEHWVERGLQRDDDLVPVQFQAGTNRLVLKVQNIQGDWAFVCRLLGKQTQADQLSRAAALGDLDTVKRCLALGIDIDGRNSVGITAAQSARLRGQTEAVDYLAAHGANTRLELPPPAQRVEAFFSRLAEMNIPGLAVLVAQDGKVLFEMGYGLADRGRHLPVTPQTQFRIGSITKQFTAASILKLQEQGKLSVTDKLSKYIPDFPRGDEVTLRHLLTHTSGIHSYTDKPDFMKTVTQPVKTEELIQSFKNDPYDFDPGAKWRYDNSGYFLLGYVVEKVSGMAYGDFLRQSFFEPLGMTNTGVHRSGLKLPHEALGYAFENGRFNDALNWDMSRAGGAGALYSTVEDLYRWNEGVFNGKVLSEASLKAAFTAVKTQDNKDDTSGDGYGYGWAISHLRGAEEISHGGGLQGFSSSLLRLPRARFTVVVLANALPGPPGAEPGALAHLVVELCLGDTLEPRPVPKIDQTLSPAALEALVGRYDYGIGIMAITRDGDRLFAQLAGQPRAQIFPKSETEFFWKAVDAQVSFVKDTSGKVTKAVHHQNGQTIDAPRLADIAEAKVDPATYDAFLGKYDYGQGQVILTVTRSGDHLYAQLTGQPQLEIFPKSPAEFFWKVVDAQVTFVKDAGGKVTKAIHHQGGQTIEAPKVE